MQELAAALTRYEGKDVRRLDPLHSAWDIREPGPLSQNKKTRFSVVDACRSAVWEALRSSNLDTFIRHHEVPGEYEVSGFWQPHGKRTWRIPQGFDPSDRTVSSWLSIGGWMAYAAAAPMEGAGNLFDMTAEQVTEWAERHQVALVIASFLDDLEWRVFVREGAT